MAAGSDMAMQPAIWKAEMGTHFGEWWTLSALREFAVIITQTGVLDILDMPAEGTIVRPISSNEILEVFIIDPARERAFLEPA